MKQLMAVLAALLLGLLILLAITIEEPPSSSGLIFSQNGDVIGYIKLLDHKDAVVREQTARALGELGPKATAAIPALRKALAKEPEESTQIALASALKNIGQDGLPADDKDVVKVGILHSLSGTMAISETSLKDAEMLAIGEINAAGGILGKKIVPVIEDPASRFTDKFPELAQKLLVKDKVAAVFGCWTSVSRKNVLAPFEDNNVLLFYPVQYEGNECSKNCVYSGGVPNQQILPAVEWFFKEKGCKKFYLIGTDYVNPRTEYLIVAKYLESKGLKVVDEVYTAFGHRDYARIVQDIKDKSPDVIFSAITGDSNTYFYNELAAQGVTAEKFPVVALNVAEDELRSLDPAKVKGHYAAWNYFQSLDTPKNKEFVKKFQAKYGKDRVTDDPIAAAYAQVYLWKLAVEKAKSFDVDKVREAIGSSGIEFDAPEGKIKLDPKTQHVYKYFRLGKIRDDRQLDVVYQTKEWIEPDPYPQVAFPGWRCDWTKGGLTRDKAVQIAPKR